MCDNFFIYWLGLVSFFFVFLYCTYFEYGILRVCKVIISLTVGNSYILVFIVYIVYYILEDYFNFIFFL